VRQVSVRALVIVDEAYLDFADAYPERTLGRLAQALKKQGLDNPHLFNRLAVAAATASLKDTGYLTRVSTHVAREREQWFQLPDGVAVASQLKKISCKFRILDSESRSRHQPSLGIPRQLEAFPAGD
jgi:histidinol-phosphate/aromatic aminotransferase/cobyric acid decarboxylase-like protein